MAIEVLGVLKCICEGQLGESALDARHPGSENWREKDRACICGNDGSEDLPHAHKTITVSLHGYSHESDFYCNSALFSGRASKLRVFFHSNQVLLYSVVYYLNNYLSLV